MTICARCRHFTSQVPPETAALKRGQCVQFLVAILDYVDWNGTCRKFNPARQTAERDSFIKKMETACSD